jgi:hypothetical protein
LTRWFTRRASRSRASAGSGPSHPTGADRGRSATDPPAPDTTNPAGNRAERRRGEEAVRSRVRRTGAAMKPGAGRPCLAGDASTVSVCARRERLPAASDDRPAARDETVQVDEGRAFAQRCPEQQAAVIQCTAFVNWRRIEVGDRARSRWLASRLSGRPSRACVSARDRQVVRQDVQRCNRGSRHL